MNFYGSSPKAGLPAREQAHIPCASAAGREPASAEPRVASARATVGMYGVNVYVLNRQHRTASRQRSWEHAGISKCVCGYCTGTRSTDHCGVRM